MRVLVNVDVVNFSTATLAVHISIFTGSLTWLGWTTLTGMHSALDALFGANDVVGRADALHMVHPVTLQRGVRAGRLIRPLPRVYLRGGGGELVKAAAVYASDRAAFSHTTALAIQRIPVPDGGLVHLMGDERCRLRGGPGVRVHRRAGLVLEPPEVVTRSGLRVVRLERSIVDSWPLLDHDAQRAPMIYSVARRLATPDRIDEALAAVPRLAGRRHFAALLRLLRIGCHSPLELWGYQKVSSGRSS